MPDVLEMPYRPDVFLVESQGALSQEKQPAVAFEGEVYQHAGDGADGDYVYRLGGPTCLAGDVVGDFSFSRKLRVGDIIVFDDMAHYTMVKTTTFNGVKHPPIALQHPDGRLEVVREFHYEDFRDRLC
jgi:carboxynorspermidine decarboxylase